MAKQLIISNVLFTLYIFIFSWLIFFDVKGLAKIFVNFIWISKEDVLLFPYASFIFFLAHIFYLIKTKQVDFSRIFILMVNAILMCAVCYFQNLIS